MSVVSVAVSTNHEFSKTPSSSIILIKGLGVEGDCHLGETVQHRSRLHLRPPPSNLRQVHLIQNEILQELGVKPHQIGENVTTEGIDLLGLGKGTKLHFMAANDVGLEAGAEHPVVVITGLRNPCPQIEKFQKGLQEKFILRNEERKIIGRKAGVMSTVEAGGVVTTGMKIMVEQPLVYEPLGCV